ncbi:Eukaryotic initiation factor 4E family protein [Trichomonas vaginalis G3]|uniref:Eukaryotic initiation factor 4E family protein n=1 Tax=Trichomonas vaginalis (strain ATCC PRA-98 / G3) TaxID=412133 RepID=A2E3Q5_TRIV3|nr:translation initiation factor protein [Trichomonas vaginalis G3]EAY12693.1 Eukaryotic initiation factor 4E family protein [Trichomonas vaginalis G3]KAI5517545.1 translation initiation factor protein [Trichomonas vaginalis G3]|eukprot:XP_001324916.1 Eukaryotic initiation factor 4E family protein [Trichomonas vaginalis G3]
MSHPLESPWTFYIYSSNKGQRAEQDYLKCITKIAKVNTVEEFWAVYSHTIPPSKLKQNFALHFFRGDSRAVREDEENQNGGTFFVKLLKNHASQEWEKLLLDFISENIHKDVIGAVVSVRIDSERLLIWNKTSSDPSLRLEIANQLAKCLNLPFKSKIEYLAHQRIGNSKPIIYTIEAEGAVEQHSNNNK